MEAFETSFIISKRAITLARKVAARARPPGLQDQVLCGGR